MHTTTTALITNNAYQSNHGKIKTTNAYNEEPRPTKGAELPVGVGWIGRLGGVYSINQVAYKRCAYPVETNR
jgi:carbohydrate-selective porin OprB